MNHSEKDIPLWPSNLSSRILISFRSKRKLDFLQFFYCLVAEHILKSRWQELKKKGVRREGKEDCSWQMEAHSSLSTYLLISLLLWVCFAIKSKVKGAEITTLSDFPYHFQLEFFRLFLIIFPSKNWCFKKNQVKGRKQGRLGKFEK